MIATYKMSNIFDLEKLLISEEPSYVLGKEMVSTVNNESVQGGIYVIQRF
jgi:hypothetical protein